MSGLELLAVVACVAAVCSAYRDGAELVSQIKAKRKARKALQQEVLSEYSSTTELELSLKRGGGVVRSQYDRDFRRYGATFANGDRKLLPCSYLNILTHLGLETARDALKDIIIHLQGQVISNLKIQWQQDTFVDFNVLQDVSDESQDRAILVLMQLQQRIITSAPIEELEPPFLVSSPKPLNNHTPQRPLPQITSPSTPSSPQRFDIPSIALPAPPVYRPSAPLKYSSTGDVVAEKKSHFASVTRIAFFGRRLNTAKKSLDGSVNSKFIMSPLQNHHRDQKTRRRDVGMMQALNHQPDLAIEALDPISRPNAPSQDVSIIKDFKHSPLPALEVLDVASRANSESQDMGIFKELNPGPYISLELLDPSSRPISIATPTSGTFEPETPDFNPWVVQRSPSPSQGSHVSFSSGSRRRIPTSTLEVVMTNSDLSVSSKDLLPGEANKFAGFCKGAWRLQIGDKKKAMEERQRPDRMYSAKPYWQCSKCKFEGRMIVHDRKNKGFDTRVITEGGVRFRWEFLFKSHIESKESTSDPSHACYGCIFCCVEGRGTPIFGGIKSFITHLQGHNDHLPTGEVLYRMNCLVGRSAAHSEDFDINLVGRNVEEV